MNPQVIEEALGTAPPVEAHDSAPPELVEHAAIQYLRDPKTPKELKAVHREALAEAEAEAGRTRHECRKANKATTASIQTFDEIEAEPVSWLWPGRIAIGKQTLFVGDPGLGKSQGSLDVAARLSTGIAFPDGELVGEIGDSLILTSEDDPGDTIRPRLDALGADLRRVHFFRCKVGGDGKQDFPTLRDLDTFKDAADQIRAKGGRLRLVIIDPLEGYLDGADAHKNAEVRSVLSPLVALAAKEGFAILGIQHLNKGAGPAAYRVGGSIAFTALARAVWVFVKDAEDPDRRLFLCLKNNLGRDQAGFEYRIEQAENGAPFIRWLGPADDDVRDALAHDRPKREREKVAPEQDRILDFMRSRAPVAVKANDIAEAIGKTPSATGNLLTKLLAQGLVKRAVPFGFWQLSSPVTLEMNTESAESAESMMIEDSSLSLDSAASLVLEGDESTANEPEPEIY